MALALGSGTPLGYYVGSTQATAMYLGSTLVYSASPAAWNAYYSDTFTGTTGAAPNSNWRKATTYPTAGTVTIQSNAMRISTNSTSAWTAAASVFLGNPASPQTAPAIYPDFDVTFDYTLANLLEHYPTIGIRSRNAELWNGGGGGNTPTTGYALVLAPQNKTVDIISCYNSTSIIGTPITVATMTSAAMKWRILVNGTRLAFKVWLTGTEPGGTGSDSNWTYDNPSLLFDRSDGGISFSVANGPAAATKTVTIDNFVATTRPLGGYSGAQPAPTATVSGFTPYFVENFDTAAAAGTGTGQFTSAYANSWTPYTASGTMQPQQMISAHDGVMDIAMDGTRGSAGWWGPPATSQNRVGGRFSMRAKCIGAYNNGPAVMIWPSSDVWADGEIDFPESISYNGGTQGFQDAPWIHHHKMVAGQEGQAQDVALGVSWRDWHVYTCEWYPPGKGPNPSTGTVIYYVDGTEVYRTTTDVPTTAHRYTVQVGDYGASGNMYIDWVRIDAVT